MDRINLYEKKDGFELIKDVQTDLVWGEETKKEVFFTIMMPTFKRAETLRVAIESALNQIDYDDYEIIVVNNDPEGKVGDTLELIKSINDDKIRYYVNRKNVGLCGNWNRCIELARGEYIVMLHDDDMISPYFLKTVRDKIDKYKAGIIGVSFYSFNSQNIPEFVEPNSVGCSKITKFGFFFGHNINIAGMTFKRDLAIEIGGFWDDYYPAEDTFFIYQILLNNKVININFPLAGYRQELNLSMKESVMNRIMILVELCRKNMAEHELFAKIWMKIFDKEYFVRYIDAGANYWSMKLDKRLLLSEVGLDDKPLNGLKVFVMKAILYVINKLITIFARV